MILFFFSEPVDFSRPDGGKLNLAINQNSSSETNREFTHYSTLTSKGSKSISILRSLSSDDLELKSSDENTDDGSDVDILGDHSKGYLT